jgi:hypothetical protein
MPKQRLRLRPPPSAPTATISLQRHGWPPARRPGAQTQPAAKRPRLHLRPYLRVRPSLRPRRHYSGWREKLQLQLMLCRLVCAFYLSLLFNLILLQYKCPGDRVFGAALGLLAEHGSIIYIRVPGLLCQRSSVLVQSGARETAQHVATQMVDPPNWKN